MSDEPSTRTRRAVLVGAGPLRLPGDLVVPLPARGVVVFAHGTGSSRASPRNLLVAGVLHGAGLATLLFDLLTPAEARDREKVFDAALLGGRLAVATRWLQFQPDVARLPVGYFGASTGAAAALWVAAEPEARVAAVVSRGGRPDLAAARLRAVRAPTLLVVGERDPVVLELNRAARRALTCACEVVVIPEATHLFEEPGALEEVAALARDWFVRHLAPGG